MTHAALSRPTSRRRAGMLFSPVTRAISFALLRLRCRPEPAGFVAWRIREPHFREGGMATVIPPLFRAPGLDGFAVLRSRPLLLLQMLMLCIALHAAAAVPENEAPAQTESAGVEIAVKAAYLYKFLGYVEWPPAQFPGPAVPFVIGIAGNEPLARELERITAGRSVKDRRIAVRRMRPDEPLTGLHLLYIGPGDSARQMRLLKLAQQRPILTVTDTDTMGATGIIHFRVVDNRVRFEVALDTAQRSGLQLSSRLLSVALAVRTGAPS